MYFRHQARFTYSIELVNHHTHSFHKELIIQGNRHKEGGFHRLKLGVSSTHHKKERNVSIPCFRLKNLILVNRWRCYFKMDDFYNIVLLIVKLV